MIIEVGYEPTRLITVDGLCTTARKAVVRGPGKAKVLRDLPLIPDVASVGFVFRIGPFTRKIRLSDGLTRALLTHLRQYQATSTIDFDCYAFVSLANSLPCHSQRYLRAFWDIRPLERRLRHGETVLLLTEESGFFHHAAIYLGMGLFISVWGAGGDIEVATLKDMRESFCAQDVRLAVPKSPEEYSWLGPR